MTPIEQIREILANEKTPPDIMLDKIAWLVDSIKPETNITAAEYQEYQEQRYEELKALSNGKGTEYAPDSDRFHNFKVARDLFNLAGFQVNGKPLEIHHAALAFQIKHIVSKFDILQNPDNFSPEQKKEKFGDLTGYDRLIERMLI